MEESHYKLLKVKYESLVLLKNRGFVIPSDEADILNNELNVHQFGAKYQKIVNNASNPLFNYFRRPSTRLAMSNIYNRGRERVLVYFAESDLGKGKKTKQISSAEVATFCRMIADLDVDEAIIISTSSPSPAIESLSNDICAKTDVKSGVFIQYFMDEELMYNPLNHIFVPNHRIITDEEIKDLEKIDKNIKSKMPQISALDPICKRIGARPNQIIEIERKILIESSLIEEEISYRSVIKPTITKK